MQSKTIYFIPCNHGKNVNTFICAETPYRLFAYSKNNLANIENVFPKAFFGSFWENNGMLQTLRWFDFGWRWSPDESGQNLARDPWIFLCNYMKYVWLHFLETIGLHQFKIRDPRTLVKTPCLKFWWIWSVDPLLRSCNVNNVCDHNRIVIKYDHEWNRTWQMDYESGSRYDRFILDRCRYPIRGQRFHFWSASDWLALENILFESSIFNLSFWFSHRRQGSAKGRPTRLANFWTVRLSLIKGEENAPEIEFNHRRSLGYFIMFSINFYICLVVCIHGSTMSNEDIERHGLTRRRSGANSSSKLLKSAATESNPF